MPVCRRLMKTRCKMVWIAFTAIFLLAQMQISVLASDKTISRSGWSKSAYSLIDLEHKWVVGTISYLHHRVAGQEFSAVGTSMEQIKWKLWIITYDGYTQTRVYLVLNSVSEKITEARVTYTIKVLDLNGKILFNWVRSVSQVFKKGTEYYLADAGLYKAITGGLVNDTVVVECAIRMGSDVSAVSSEGNAEYNFDVPACVFDEEATELILKDLKYSNTFFNVDSQLIPVPRALLASKSTELDQLFEAAKKPNEEPTKIALKDIDKETVDFVIRFAYTGEGVIPDGMETKLLDAANKYGLKALKVSTEKALSKKVTMDNALDMLDIAQQYEANQMKEYILNYIRQNALTMSAQEWKVMVDKMSAKQCEMVAEKKCEE